MSITGTILASYPLYTALLSVILNNEQLVPVHWAFVLLTIAGTILLSLPERFQKKELQKQALLLWAVIGAAAVGLSDAVSKHGINATSIGAFVFALAVMQIPVAIGYLFWEKKRIADITAVATHVKTYRFALTGSFFNIIGTLCLWLAFARTYASIASPITGASPVIFVPLAVLFLGERLKKKDVMGIIIVITGIIGLSYYFG